MYKFFLTLILFFNVVFSTGLYNLTSSPSSKGMINITGSKFLYDAGDFEINPSLLCQNNYGFIILNYNMPYSMGYLADNINQPLSGDISAGFPFLNHFALGGSVFYFNDKQTSLDLSGEQESTDIINNSLIYKVTFRYSYLPYIFKNNLLKKFNTILFKKSLKKRFGSYSKLRLKTNKFNFSLGVTGKLFNLVLDKENSNLKIQGYLFDLGAYFILFYNYYISLGINNFPFGFTSEETVNYVINISFSYNKIYRKNLYYFVGAGYQTDLFDISKLIFGTSIRYVFNNTKSVNGVFLMKNIFHSIGGKLSYNMNTDSSSLFNWGVVFFFDLGTIVKYLRIQYSVQYKQYTAYDNLFSISYNFLESAF